MYIHPYLNLYFKCLAVLCIGWEFSSRTAGREDLREYENGVCLLKLEIGGNI